MRAEVARRSPRVEFTVAPGRKETPHVGIEKVTSKGFYYKLSDGESTTPKLTYYRNGQEKAPLPGKVTWAT